MTVDMTLDLSKLEVKSNRAFLLTPRLIGQQDTLDLPAVGIYGRRRYYYYLREDNGMISGEDETVLKIPRDRIRWPIMRLSLTTDG